MKIQYINSKIWPCLRDRINDWTETPAYLPFESFNPKANEAYVIIDPVGLDVDIASIDYNCGSEHRGFINARIMTPTTWDYAATTGMMDRFAELLPAGWRGSYQDANVEVYRVVSTDTPTTEAAWHRRDIRIYWRCWG